MDLVPNAFLFEKHARGQEHRIVANLLDHFSPFCNYGMLADSTPGKKEWLNGQKTQDMKGKVAAGNYTDFFLYKDNRTVFEIRNKSWQSLKLHLTTEELLAFREFLAGCGLPRSLFISESEAGSASADRKK